MCDKNIHHYAHLFRSRLTAALERSGLCVKQQGLSPEDAYLVRQAYERYEEPLEVVVDDHTFSPTDTNESDIEAFLAAYTTLTTDTDGSASPESQLHEHTLPEEDPVASLSQQHELHDNDASGEVASLPSSSSPPSPTTTVRPGEIPNSPASSTMTPSPITPRPTRNSQSRSNNPLSSFVESVHRPGENRKYQCTLCGHCSSRAHDVRRHVTKHGIVFPHECLACGERFKRTDARGRHWAKNPECKTIDEQLSRGSNHYGYRHGRKKKEGSFQTAP